MIPVLRSIAYIRRYWPLATFAFISLSLATLFSLIVPQILRNVIDHGLPMALPGAYFTSRFMSEGLEVNQPRPQLIFTSAALLLGLSFLRAAVAFGQRFFGERLSHHVAYDIRNDLYDKVQHLPFSYHDQSQMGEIITRAITDIDAVRGFIAQALMDGINVTVLIMGVIAAMAVLSPSLTLVAMLPVPLIILTAIHMGTLQITRWRAIMEQMSSLSNLLEETVIGIQVVRAFNRQQAESQRWAVINQRLYHGQVSFTETWSTAFPLMAFLVAVCTGLMLWQGGPQVVGNQGHRLSIGTIVALNGYILLLAMPVQRLGFVVQQLSSASTSARRIFEIIDSPQVLSEKAAAVQMPSIKGYVRFKDVSLRYRPESKDVLTGISFETQPDQVIGIVGPTGGGKTSIVNLIPRFYDVTSGCVTIDGIDVRDVKLESLRRQVGLVLQETLLFTASIRENIAYGNPDASEDDIIAASQAADAHGFIDEMPQGYDTLIGERGVTISGGQRQRIAIARALLINPHILILDDSTSSVDTRTENRIQQALRGLMKNRVTFIVAQRLSAIQHADLILVVDGGQIIERGSHHDLIAQGGLYAHIYQEQMQDQERVKAERDSS
jgi:ATP-binding cassette, subfamily B, multidrug efflux pump